MANNPEPVFIGEFPWMKAADVLDLYIDIANDLVTGETISSVAFTVTDSAGDPVVGAVGSHSETDDRTDFRLTVPSTAGTYTLSAVFTISDGQQITREAKLKVV